MSENWELTVIPAYGRDYKTAEEAFTAWMADKDFYIMTPRYPSYINKADAETYKVPNNIIRIRYKKKTELLIVEFDSETKKWINKGSTEEDECPT